MQRLRKRGSDDGFTLIELMVVVVIIGILIAIAIPLYLNYENGAKNKSSASDLRGAISTIEQCKTDTATLPVDFTTTSSYSPCPGQTINVSTDGNLAYYVAGDTYMLVSYQTASSIWYCYNSGLGGAVATESGPLATSYAACPSP